MAADPTRLPDWLAAEVSSWPEDAWGVHHARVLLRDGRVVEPVAIMPSGDLVGWADAGQQPFSADDIVAIEPADDRASAEPGGQP